MFGLQVENEAELAEVYARLKAADPPGAWEEGATTCCYAQSEKKLGSPIPMAWCGKPS